MDQVLNARVKEHDETPTIRLEGKMIVVKDRNLSTRFHSRSLPQRYIDWINAGRRGMYDRLLDRDGSLPFFAPHLPVLVTYSNGRPFPFNCANKGVGFIPKAPYLSEFIERFEDTLDRTRGLPWKQSLKERIQTVSRFYFDREKIDYRAMSGLEIFARKTFRNLLHTPQAALLFTGGAPRYTSFQLNCVTEIIGEDDPRYRFIRLARVMFEYDDFHIAQNQFSYAYLFWISEVIDKTPFRVERAGGKTSTASHPDLQWQDDALEAVGRAPEMIQAFIREKIEAYAREKGCREIDLALTLQARGQFERTPPKKTPAAPRPLPGRNATAYTRIYVPVDGSEGSREATRLAIEIARRDRAEIIGSHVYAARLHDSRFKAMEGGLPEVYQKEEILEEQRTVHDTLITKGLKLISDSYLESMQAQCREHRLAFRGTSLEGRNWEALVKDIHTHDYDLVVLGGHGMGHVRPSLLGTVAERLLRRIRRDLLICKKTSPEDPSDLIVVCLDGSPRSWGALDRGLHLAKSMAKRLIAVSAFDPYFHSTMFKTLNQTLSSRARSVFKFEQQEQLHESIIDSGLAKIYQSHLNIARGMGEAAGIRIETRLLAGKAFEKILGLLKETRPWLTILGRVGIHGPEEMDIGGTTENLCRLAPGHVLIVDAIAQPPPALQAEQTVTWTKEARAKMKNVPPHARGIATKSVQDYCLAKGHTVVTRSILDAAIHRLLPPEALERMGMTLGTPASQAKTPGPDTAIDTKPQKRCPFHTIATKLSLRKKAYECPLCGRVIEGSKPRACPSCQTARLRKLTAAEREALPASATSILDWDAAALERLEKIPAGFMRQWTRGRIERGARASSRPRVTLEMVEAKYNHWREGSRDRPRELEWTGDALGRVNKIPGFIRPIVIKEVEGRARSWGVHSVNGAVLDRVLENWGDDPGAFHLPSNSSGP